MTAEYRLDVYTAAGVLAAQLTGIGGQTGGFLTLAYSKRVNDVGILNFVLEGDNPAIALLEHKSIIEVWRRNIVKGIDWYCDFTTFWLDQVREFRSRRFFTASCPGVKWLLTTRPILYYADTANRSKFTAVAAETVMKTLVNYNAGPNATVANGRMRTPNTLGITIAADTAAGNVIDLYCAWDDLLKTLQKVAAIGGGDFDLVRNGAAGWEFRWYTGQLGTDRSATVRFAVELGNMESPVYKKTRSTEATVVVAAGQGEGTARAVRTRTGDDYGASNDVEMFLNASSEETNAALDDAADTELRERKAVHELAFNVLQEGPSLYGRDYFLGDLVTGQYDDIEVTRKVEGVSVSFNGAMEGSGGDSTGDEDIVIEMGED